MTMRISSCDWHGQIKLQTVPEDLKKSEWEKFCISELVADEINLRWKHSFKFTIHGSDVQHSYSVVNTNEQQVGVVKRELNRMYEY